MQTDLPQLFDELAAKLRARPERTAGLNGCMQLNLEGEGGGTWHVRFDDGRPEVAPGAAQTPDVVSTMQVEDYVEMATGNVTGRELFFAGRMRVEGNPMLGMQFGTVMAD